MDRIKGLSRLLSYVVLSVYLSSAIGFSWHVESEHASSSTQNALSCDSHSHENGSDDEKCPTCHQLLTILSTSFVPLDEVSVLNIEHDILLDSFTTGFSFVETGSHYSPRAPPYPFHSAI